MNENSGSQQAARGRSLRRDGGGVRRHTVRRHLYMSMIAASACFVAESGLEKLHPISEGAVFIMVDAVGLIMPTATTDIGQNILFAIREEGDKTRASQDNMFTRFIEALREEGDKTRALIAENGARMDERLDRMTSAIVSVSNDIKAVSNDIKAVSNDIKTMSADNRAFFRQMLEAQNRILEKVS